MQVLAIIPARGGSKGIPQKNIRPLRGRPLLAYSIEAVRQAPAVSRVVVSTDDEQIAGVAYRYGAEVIRRPSEISGDTASSESALLHALDFLKENENWEPELVVFLQATSPLRRPEDVQAAVETLQSSGADSLFSACHVEGFTWRAALKGKDENGAEEGAAPLRPVNYDPTQRPRRQELSEEILEENGSIYVFKPWVLRQLNSRLGGQITVYRMERLDSFQLDTPGDIPVLETLLDLRLRSQSLPAAGRQLPAASSLAEVRLLIFDFDGVMTDNRALVDQNGEEAVWVNRADGWGIARLKEIGLEMAVLSTEANPVVAARCRKLGLNCIQGLDDKLAALQELACRRGLEAGQIAYLGNDVNDLACLGWVGWPLAVADSYPPVLAVARRITQSRGGQGAVREAAEWFLQVHSASG